jgi:hypothetical protein
MACKEHHRIGYRAGSLEGCWILAGDNVPGYHALMTSRPGGVPENRKVRQGMQSKSRYARKVKQAIIPKFTVNLGCAHHMRLRFGLRQSSAAFGIWCFSGAWRLALGIFLCVLCVLLRLKIPVISWFQELSSGFKGGGVPPQNQPLPPGNPPQQ